MKEHAISSELSENAKNVSITTIKYVYHEKRVFYPAFARVYLESPRCPNRIRASRAREQNKSRQSSDVYFLAFQAPREAVLFYKKKKIYVSDERQSARERSTIRSGPPLAYKDDRKE